MFFFYDLNEKTKQYMNYKTKSYNLRKEIIGGYDMPKKINWNI